MKTGFIAVGTELLWENKIETNKNELAKILSNFGFEIQRELIIKDDIKELLNALGFLEDFDLIIISGGLGPTKDDITREGLSKYFNSPLKYHKNLFEELKGKYEKKGFKLRDIAKRQFFTPSAGKPLKNEKGTAPGILIKKGKKTIMAFPGVPEEFIFMLDSYLLPFLKTKRQREIYIRTYNLSGTFESWVEEKLIKFYEKFPHKKITILASAGIVSITIKECDRNIFKKMDKEIKIIFKDEIFSYDNKKLNEKIFDLLEGKKKTISFAESCTGGGLTYELVKIPGISKYLKGGVVAYSNEAKEKILKVSKSSLKKFGAVSFDVAKEMSENVRQKFNSDIGVSITGIAGPEGGTLQKPVGLVFIGISTKELTNVQKYQFSGSRGRIQKFSINFALDLLRKVLG